MNCNETQEYLELLVLGGLAPDRRAAVEAHIAQCPSCRADLADCRQLVLTISRVDTDHGPRATSDFERAIHHAGAQEIARLHSRRNWRRVAVAAGSLAAAAAIAIVAWGFLQGSPAGEATDSRLATERPERPVTPATAPSMYGGTRTLGASQADGIVVVDRTIYMRRNEADGANLTALDAVTREARWQGQFAVRGYLAADRNRVYCLADGPGRTLDLVALDPADGSELWRCTQDRPRRLDTPCHPLPLDSNRVGWIHGRTVHMLDAASGQTIWTRTIAGHGLLSGLVADQTGLYVADVGAVHCLDRHDGTDVWAAPLPDELIGRSKPRVALAGGRLYVVQARPRQFSRLLCLGTKTRKVLWHRNVPPTRSLLAADHGVYLRGARIIALGCDKGEQLWSRTAVGCGPLTLFEGRIHFVDTTDEGRLIALDPTSGVEAWQVAGIRSCGAFTRVGRVGYIRTPSGALHAVEGRGNGGS